MFELKHINLCVYLLLTNLSLFLKNCFYLVKCNTLQIITQKYYM